MFTHDFDPVLLDLGFIAIRWYSLAYIFGILIGWWYGKKIITKRFDTIGKKFELKKFDDLITYLIVSIIFGGRIGYVIFYDLQYFIDNPINILKVWEGGMSFHGALIGVILGTYLFSQIKNIQALFLLDIIACVAPIGIFFGRIANFINGELIGKTSNVIWSVIFPAFDRLPRHPSQLYEAFLEGLLLFFLMNKIIVKKNYTTGTCAFTFLILYGIFRIIAEFFREPDAQIGLVFNLISMGTFLSTIMIIAGLIMIFIRRNAKQF